MPRLGTKVLSDNLVTQKNINDKAGVYFDSLFRNGSKLHNFTSSRKHIETNDRYGENEKESVAVIGSGNFGRAIATKIAQSGYKVNIGSRDPEKYRYISKTLIVNLYIQ